MGREALCYAEVDGEAGEVRALLESTELILRGHIRRHFAKADIAGVKVQGEVLCFTVAGETVRLHLGARGANAWSTAIAKPPPSLRAKLGLDKGARAILVGTCDDAVLAEALDGVLVDNVAAADMIITRIEGPDDLVAAQAAHDTSNHAPIWAIYPKGKGVAFGDTAIRSILREAGFRDTKSCAVSDRLTATRYNHE